MNTLIGYDLVPEPKILEAALRACRRLNDLASAIRILEAVKVREKLLSWLIIQGILTTSILAVSGHELMNNGFYHFLYPQHKAGPHKEIYPYLIQELRPILDELGISTPEELGIDKV